MRKAGSAVRGEGAGLRILVIDDEADYRYILVTGLGLEGHQVFEAGAFGDGLSAAAECDPDVVLIDLVMAGGSGMSLLPRLRRTCPRSAMVFHTVERERALPMVGHPSGPDGLLEKGMAPKELSVALEGIYAVHRARNETVNGDRGSAPRH
jgi:two-component system, OmpR family, response regulator